VRTLYIILATSGWVWLGVLAGYVILKLRRNVPRGFDVAATHASLAATTEESPTKTV
jgi:hypothetical protein